jgi:hypothetical protein
MGRSKQPALATLAINATVLYVVAFLLTTVLHELAHAVVGAALGGRPVLHHNHVAGGGVELSAARVVAVKLAGPAFSLLQALALTPLVVRRRRRDAAQLLLLWMMALGYNNFLGYLFTGPFAPAGDIGAAARIAEVPMAGVVAVSLAGIAGQLLVVWHLRRPFLSFAFDETQLASAAGRKRVLLHSLILPWLVGSLAFTLVSLPSPAWLSTIYPLSSGMPFIMPWQAAGNPRARDGVVASDGRAAASVSWLAVVVLLALVAFNQLVLRPGIALAGAGS